MFHTVIDFLIRFFQSGQYKKYVIIILNIFFLMVWGTVLTRSFSNDLTNERPIIGILAHELSSEKLESLEFFLGRNYSNGYKSYIAASYVKAMEAAGSRVVPVWIHQPESYYKKIISSVNGILLPGGAADFDVPNGYAEAGVKLYKLAKQANKQGVYFPIWGTCLGFELMTFAAANEREHRCDCDSYNDALPLEFTSDFEDSKLFSEAPVNIINILATRKVTVNFHHFCVTEKNMTDFGLMKDWHILSYNKDSNGLVFVSTIEHRKYPFYAVMFHPEKNAFEWKISKKQPHFPEAITSAQFFAEFFVNEARRNWNKFSSPIEEQESLIYNFPVTYTSKQWVFEQCYLFR